jgi:hypothetical protein
VAGGIIKQCRAAKNHFFQLPNAKINPHEPQKCVHPVTAKVLGNSEYPNYSFCLIDGFHPNNI